jgi:hypothetical protein
MTTRGRRPRPASRPGATTPRAGKARGNRPPAASRPGAATPRAGKAQAGKPRPAGGSLHAPDAGTARSSVERASARPLVFLRQLPAWVPLLAVLALLIAGFTLPGWIGATALLVIGLFLGWLGYLSWPALAARGRLLRVAAVAVVLALAVIQARR